MSQLAVGKEPWLAVNLSMFFPGIGQIYAGKTLRGCFFIVVQLLLLILGFWLIFSPVGDTKLGVLLILATIFVTIWSCIDAYRCAKKLNSSHFEQLRKNNKDPWRAVFLSRILPGIGHFYLGKIGFGFLFLVTFLLAFISPFLSFLVYSGVAYHAYISARNRRERSQKAILLLCIALILFSGNLLSPILKTVVEARYIPSGSMLPTLQLGDRLIIDKLSYRFQEPKRADIIIFKPTETLKQQNFKDAFVDRIIGLPGEQVEVKGGKVFINNQPLQENYIAESPQYQYSLVKVPQNSYFVLGDNRNNSYDSHYWGFVPRENITGKVSKRFYPFDRQGAVK